MSGFVFGGNDILEAWRTMHLRHWASPWRILFGIDAGDAGDNAGDAGEAGEAACTW